MRNKILLVLALLIGSFGVVMAQNATVKGKVTDKKNGDELQGARVVLTAQSNPATKYGKIVGKNGVYEITNIPPGKYSAEVSYVGYKTAAQAVSVDNGASLELNFQLILDIRGLDEIVVTGVASRTSKAVSEVAVGRVNAEQLTDKVAYTSTGQLLTGKVSGVTVQQASGNVGGGLRFVIRGGAGLFGGDPVIFLDGVRIGGGNITGFGAGGQQVSALADLNPNDIQDIQVLKGAAASALYGTAGQNGVILISTKRGRTSLGNEMTINYQGTFGWNEPSRTYTENQMISYREANAIMRGGPQFTPQGLQIGAPLMQHNVNLTGSSGIFNYFVGYENRAEQGIMTQNAFNRQNVRLNLDAVTSRDLKLSASMQYTDTKNDRPQNDNNVLGWIGNTQLYSPFLPDPANGFRPVRRAFGTYQFTDSLAIAQAENTFQTRRLIGSAQVNYDPSWLPGLKLAGTVGFDGQSYRSSTFFPSTQFYSGVIRGSRGIFEVSTERINYELSAEYTSKNILGTGVNSITRLATQAFNSQTRTATLTAQRFGTDLVRDIGSGESLTFGIGEGFSNFRDAGIILRQEFRDAAERFALYGGVRNDYASSLNPEASAVFYPQAGAMVRLDKLGFLPENFTQLKLRAAYGESGSLPGQLSAQRLLFTVGQSGYGPGGILSISGNPSIVAERNREFEVGLEFEIDNTFSGEFTYVNGVATNSLINVPRAPSRGVGALPSNLGSALNWGFESELAASLVQSRDYSLDVKFIFNYFDTMVESIGGAANATDFIQDGFTRNFIIAGQRRSQFIGPRPLAPRFRANGYYDFANGPQMDTARANGAIYGPLSGSLIGHAIGSSVPLYTGAFSVNFRFLKDFTLYALAEYGLGGFTFNGTRQFHTQTLYSNNIEFNRLANALGLAAGQPGQISANIPRYDDVTVLTPNTPEYQSASERFMRLDPVSLGRGNLTNFTERSDWVRLREVSLAWDATPSFVQAGIPVKNLRFTLTGRNLFLWTPYTGVEVEINGNPGSIVSSGQDFLTLQQARSYSLVVSLGF